ncbi:MAG TPA: DUF2752 domain-containing protein [Pyrinomonadaceae bacterium]|jgi:hypothetical protein|nr:DUF2752 domain-containing protein [Pyrinomonadaceae bacterium]
MTAQLKSSTAERGAAFVCVAGMSAAAFAVGYFNPATAGFFPVCPLFKLTGIACPGCGMTRGLHALLHGDVLGALGYNLLLPAVLFFFGYLFVSLFLTFARGRGLNFKAFTPLVIWSFFGLAIAFTVLRNLPYYPFNILYP